MKIKHIQVRRSNIIVVIIYLTLSFGIILASYFFYQRQRNRIETDIKNQLLSISHYKSTQISNWIDDRLHSAKIISTSFPINNSLQNFFNNSSNVIERNNLIGIMESFRRCYGYESIYFVGKNGVNLINIPHAQFPTHTFDSAVNDEVMRNKKVLLSDFHRNEQTRKVELNIHIPLLRIDERDTTLFGTFICSIDPYRFLYPLILSWPTNAKTAESFIVRHEGSDLLYLSELKFIHNSALNFLQPDTNKNLPAAMAADGKEGIVEGMDYRGINVLAAITNIPNTPWFLVSKQDIDEIYEPLRKSSYVVSSIIILLLLAAGFATAFYIKKNNMTFYKELYKMEVEKNVLMQHFDYLIKYANDIILLLNQEGIIVEANNKATETYGYSKEELIGSHVKQLIDEKNADSASSQMSEVERSGGLVIEHIHKKKNGASFPVEISARVIEIENVKYYQGIIRDITERKKNEELISAALVKAKESDKLKSEFLAQMSHEVRTPLNAVLNFSSLIKAEFENKLSEDFLEIFNGIELEGKRITRTIDSILNLSQLQSGTFEYHIDKINLGSDLFPSLINAYSFAAKAKNLELRYYHYADDSIIVADQYSVEQIFLNLLDNAVKYTEEGFVEVRVLKNFESVIIEVEDSGLGIANEFIPKIYDPFTQEDRGYSRRFEGNGLGLALVKKFCEVNNAVIEVESKKNVGTTFRVRFSV